MNTENITRVRQLDLNTVLYSRSAYQSQGSSAAGHWINVYMTEHSESGINICDGIKFKHAFGKFKIGGIKTHPVICFSHSD